jgi:hypothetical protein
VSGHAPLKGKRGALPLEPFTVMTLSPCAKNGHWGLHGLQFWNQSDLLLAYSGGLRLAAADQIAWVRSTPSFRPCFRKWSLNVQNTVQGKYGTPSSKLGGWGYGGCPVFPKSQALPLCLAHFTTKLWLSRAPSAYWVITVCTNFQRLGVDE